MKNLVRDDLCIFFILSHRSRRTTLLLWITPTHCFWQVSYQETYSRPPQSSTAGQAPQNRPSQENPCYDVLVHHNKTKRLPLRPLCICASPRPFKNPKRLTRYLPRG